MRQFIQLILFGLFCSVPAFADSWMPPEPRTYLSSDKTKRFIATPRDLTSALAYFSDQVEGISPAGQRRLGQTRARGVLERRSGSRWSTMWEGPLLNDVGPVSALVTNDGAYVVTFDNWHSTGFGDNVVVIYRSNGSVVRSMRLTDILPEDYVRALPTSVSSMWWSGDHYLSRDSKRVILKVRMPSPTNHFEEPRDFLDVSIELSTGTVAPLSGPAWRRAIAVAAPVAARSKAAEAAWRAEEIAPLIAPSSTNDQAWRRYLYKASTRLNGGRELISNDWILPEATNPEFNDRVNEIRKVFVEWGEGSDLNFASPANPIGLATTLVEAASQGRLDGLRGSRLWVALPVSLHSDVATALRRSGAVVVLFDPATPIPQRAERLRELGVAPNQVEAEGRRSAEEARRFEAEAVRLETRGLSDNQDESGATIALIVAGIVTMAVVAGATMSNYRR